MFDVYGQPINAPAIGPLGRVGETRSSDPSYLFGLSGNDKLVPETDKKVGYVRRSESRLRCQSRSSRLS